ncbi:MAG: lyase [Proteobacteria bacterium]|nr:lyase [Pseudomonadota bacterium]
MRTVVSVIVLAAALLLPDLSAAADFRMWQVPWEKTRPRDPAVDAKGRVWFVGQGGDYVAWLDPQSGEFTRHDLPDGTGPHNLVVGRHEDRAGDIWIAGNRAGWIGRMDPESGDLEKFDTTKDNVKDPHTLIEADDGRIWFTAQHSNRIGVFDPESRDIQVWEAATERARPYGIVLDENGQPWSVLVGTNKLATIEDGKLRQVDLPRVDARPRRLDIVDGKIWYVDYAGGYVGSYSPENDAFEEWRSPSGEDAAPYGAVAAGDIFYYVETGPQPNRMIGINTETGNFIYDEPVPDSGGAVRHMFHDAKRDAIWFGTDTNYIGRFNPPR